MAWIGQQLLTALPSDGCVTLTELVALTGLTRPQIGEAIATMARRGFVIRARKGCYRLTIAGDTARRAGANVKSGPTGPHGHRDPGLRGRVWKALRQVRKATVIELLELASTGEEKGAVNNASRYLNHLARRKIVTKLPRRAPGLSSQSRGHVQWLLVQDLGPEPPAGPA